MLGETISHYRILEKLGQGGMGEVYLAQDTRLGRKVALKFLAPELARDRESVVRFRNEARAAAELSHPNIAVIHDVDEVEGSDEHAGRPFLVLEYLPGQTLRDRLSEGPLPIADVIRIGQALAAGLTEAHAHGIVHRDIKSANVMLTDKGEVKILDFGLAHRADATQLTRPGTTPGTLGCISPEQLEGKPADQRSDLWSLGVVLYEMITGELPFKGEHEQAVIHAILESTPEPVSRLRSAVPPELERIVTRCLFKDPDKRYQTAQELAADLRLLHRADSTPTRSRPLPSESTEGLSERRPPRVRRALFYGSIVVLAAIMIVGIPQVLERPATRIDSIAVLPLENLTGDPAQEYFADGMTEALITELSEIGALRVISKTSAMRYKDTEKPLEEIAEELNVSAVVEGSVFRDQERVRITAQLIGMAPERHLWADSYDRDISDILALFTEVARAIAAQVQITLTPQEQARLASVQPVNPQAYDLLLRGDYHHERVLLGKEEVERALDYYRQAIAIESEYAEAHAKMANCYMFCGWRGDLLVDEARSKALESARRSLEIDDSLAEGHFALAQIRFFLDWDWVGAEEGYRRAIALDPNLAMARGEYGWLLTALGRFDEAFDELQRFAQLEPVNYLTHHALFRWYFCTRRHDQALAQALRMVELEPIHAPGYVWAVHEQMGRYEDAIELRKGWMLRSGESPERAAALESAYESLGARGYWLWILEDWKGKYEREPYYTAMIHAHLGDEDQVFAWLEKAYAKHDRLMHLVNTDPAWDPLRDDPRFDELLRRMNFPKHDS